MTDLRLGDSTRYTKLALEAATAYFEKGQPLVTKIASIAQVNNLNNEEIRRVMEGANHMVHNALRQKTATVEFDVATFDKVAAALGRGTGPDMVRYVSEPKTAMEKTASHEKDEEDAEHERKEGPAVEAKERREEKKDPEDAWRDREEKRLKGKKAKEKDAEQIKEASGNSQIAHEKLGQSKVEFLMALQRFVMDENGDLVKAAEDFATYPSLAAAPALLLDVLKIVKVAGHRMNCPVTFSDATMAALDEAGRKKTADQMDPTLYAAGLHIGGHPVEIIRGNHQVWHTLDTLVNQYHTAYPPLQRGPFGGEGRVNYEVSKTKTREVSDANHEVGRAV